MFSAGVIFILQVVKCYIPSIHTLSALSSKSLVFFQNCVQVNFLRRNNISVLTIRGIHSKIYLTIVVPFKANHHPKNSVDCQHHFSPWVIVSYIYDIGLSRWISLIIIVFFAGCLHTSPTRRVT